LLICNVRDSGFSCLQTQQFAGKKKGQKSGNTKKKNTKSKKMSSSRKSKSGGSDLAGKLLSTMDKHKEVLT
jgi:hypothetical protein